MKKLKVGWLFGMHFEYLRMQNSKKTKKASDFSEAFRFRSDPAGIRTQDPYIKSVLLYQLSYGIIQAEAWYIKWFTLEPKGSSTTG